MSSNRRSVMDTVKVLSKETKICPYKVYHLMRTFYQLVKQDLLAGNKVKLPHIGVLSVKSGRLGSTLVEKSGRRAFATRGAFRQTTSFKKKALQCLITQKNS
jgi:hypothetical protein